MHMIEVGDEAPRLAIWKTESSGEFTREFSLADAYNSGPTILYFFPAAFTGVCTESSCELRDDIAEFSSLNAQIFGVSVDLPFSQRHFMQMHEINYPLLSDYNKKLSTALNIIDNDFIGFQGISKRSLWLIKDGKIAFKWVAEHPGKYPPFDELKQVLRVEDVR